VIPPDCSFASHFEQRTPDLASKEQIGDFNQCITDYKLAIYNMKGFIIESLPWLSIPLYLRIGPRLCIL
jgi:hypothetical protein